MNKTLLLVFQLPEKKFRIGRSKKLIFPFGCSHICYFQIGKSEMIRYMNYRLTRDELSANFTFSAVVWSSNIHLLSIHDSKLSNRFSYGPEIKRKSFTMHSVKDFFAFNLSPSKNSFHRQNEKEKKNSNIGIRSQAVEERKQESKEKRRKKRISRLGNRE